MKAQTITSNSVISLMFGESELQPGNYRQLEPCTTMYYRSVRSISAGGFPQVVIPFDCMLDTVVLFVETEGDVDDVGGNINIYNPSGKKSGFDLRTMNNDSYHCVYPRLNVPLSAGDTIAMWLNLAVNEARFYFRSLVLINV